jgi:hypothetical protein
MTAPPLICCRQTAVQMGTVAAAVEPRRSQSMWGCMWGCGVMKGCYTLYSYIFSLCFQELGWGKARKPHTTPHPPGLPAVVRQKNRRALIEQPHTTLHTHITHLGSPAAAPHAAGCPCGRASHRTRSLCRGPCGLDARVKMPNYRDTETLLILRQEDEAAASAYPRHNVRWGALTPWGECTQSALPLCALFPRVKRPIACYVLKRRENHHGPQSTTARNTPARDKAAA